MILTVTLNPSLDRTIEVDALVRGAVHRAGHVRVDAGGKGVNIARALTANGHPATAILPSGGADGDELALRLGRAGIPHVAVPIGDAVRTNVSIVEPDGTTTKLNTPGPTLTAAELDALLAETIEAAAGASWAACSGSLPPGVSEDVYARLVRALRGAGCAVAVDTSGPALQDALAARPDVVKPNAQELAELTDRAVRTLGEAVDAAHELCVAGATAVLTSLGPDGAILVEHGRALHGEAPVDVVRSTVGAGDATLAGFIAGGGTGAEALTSALAWGAAAVGLPGSRMPGPDDLRPDEVRINASFDRDRPLGDPQLPPLRPTARSATERITR